MLLDGLQLVRFGGSVFEGVVLSARGISGEEADQVGAWCGSVRVSCAGGAPTLVGVCGVSHRWLLRDAAIVLVCICLTQACARNNKGHLWAWACMAHNKPRAAQWLLLMRAGPSCCSEDQQS